MIRESAYNERETVTKTFALYGGMYNFTILRGEGAFTHIFDVKYLPPPSGALRRLCEAKRGMQKQQPKLPSLTFPCPAMAGAEGERERERERKQTHTQSHWVRGMAVERAYGE